MLGENFVSEAADDEQPSYARCMAGTRDSVLSKFMAWVKTDPMAILWLAGMAGTGKTSIAVSMCRMLREEPAVFFGGGFFCSRSAGTVARTDVRRILPTLAVILAGMSQEFAEALAEELKNDQRLGHKPVDEQIDSLLSRPLAVLASLPRPVVFVIDALDECHGERELAELLRLVADFKCEAKVKFILTSRPEQHIRNTPISNSAHNTILHLHTINPDEVTSDIRLYITRTLEDAATEGAWYTDQDIDLLVNLSGGLFIFASTVLKYVLHRQGDAVRRDRLRKATSAITTRIAATTAVDRVFEFILMDATRPDTIDEDEMERMRNILACILTARTSLSIEVLAALLDMAPDMLRGCLEPLHSLVYVPQEDRQPGLQTLHASFGDYLFERGPAQLRITATLGHDLLAHGCLRRMAWDDLCFNVSRSHSSFEPNPKSASHKLALSLVYACLHWAHHIESASNRSAFDSELSRVFRTKFLFWLEVLSVLDKVGLASEILHIATAVVSQIVDATCSHSHSDRSTNTHSCSFSATPMRLFRRRMEPSAGVHHTSTSRLSHLSPSNRWSAVTSLRFAPVSFLSVLLTSADTAVGLSRRSLGTRKLFARSVTLLMAALLLPDRKTVPSGSGTPLPARNIHCLCGAATDM